MEGKRWEWEYMIWRERKGFERKGIGHNHPSPPPQKRLPSCQCHKHTLNAEPIRYSFWFFLLTFFLFLILVIHLFFLFSFAPSHLFCSADSMTHSYSHGTRIFGYKFVSFEIRSFLFKNKFQLLNVFVFRLDFHHSLCELY